MAIGGSRTLKLTILGDVDNLKKSLGQADDDLKKSSSGLGDFAKKAGIAFAVAGTAAAVYAGKLLVDGVKAAIEDKAAQDKLAKTLENVTGATRDQIKATEDYITKTSLANGITDDVLRPSLDRLIRSTENVTKAQELQQLALDISAGTGKDLSAVTEALAKAYDGNFTSLKKLGVKLDDNIISSKNFDAAAVVLAETFGGQATTKAETFAGKMDRLKIAFGEAQESVGSYVLDALTPLLDNFVSKGIPAITGFADTLGKTLGPAFAKITEFVRDDLLPILKTWFEFLYEEVIPAIGSVIGPILLSVRDAFQKIAGAVKDNSTELQPFYDLMRKVWDFSKKYLIPEFSGPFVKALGAIATLVETLIIGFSQLVGFMKNAYDQAKNIVNLINNNKDIFGAQAGLIPFIIGKVAGRATGGPVTGGTSYVVGEKGPELFTPNSSGMIIPNNRMGGSTNNTFNITVNGAIDREGTARSIIDVLNNSFYRGTGGANNLQTT